MSKLTLNDHLDEQLERLRNEDLTELEMALEVRRTRAICSIAHQKIENQKSIVKAIKTFVPNDELENYLPVFGINKPLLKQ